MPQRFVVIVGALGEGDFRSGAHSSDAKEGALSGGARHALALHDARRSLVWSKLSVTDLKKGVDAPHLPAP